jgi:hypothetical protein
MRYEKGSIEISSTRDVPLMQQVLRSGFVTGAQLFEFMKSENCEYSREAFYHRLRRLVGRGLVKKGEGLAQPVYWISEFGASFLVGQGEPYAGRSGTEMAKRNFFHWLELNDVHLALRKSGVLRRWVSAPEICSQNDLTRFGFAKDYDAVVTVCCRKAEVTFAMEYERTAKTEAKYADIGRRIEEDLLIQTVLYLGTTDHLTYCLRDQFAPKRKVICIALMQEFQRRLLETPVMLAGRYTQPVIFEDVLADQAARTSLEKQMTF